MLKSVGLMAYHGLTALFIQKKLDCIFWYLNEPKYQINF